MALIRSLYAMNPHVVPSHRRQANPEKFSRYICCRRLVGWKKVLIRNSSVCSHTTFSAELSYVMWCESFSLVELSSRLSDDVKPWMSWTRSSASTKSFTSLLHLHFSGVCVLERWRLFFSSLSSKRWHTRELSRLGQETLVHDAEIKMNIVVIFMRIVLETFSLCARSSSSHFKGNVTDES